MAPTSPKAKAPRFASGVAIAARPVEVLEPLPLPDGELPPDPAADWEVVMVGDAVIVRLPDAVIKAVALLAPVASGAPLLFCTTAEPDGDAV
jgi:hypothetical protein